MTTKQSSAFFAALMAIISLSFLNCSKCVLPEGSAPAFTEEESKWIPKNEHIRDSVYFRCGSQIKAMFINNMNSTLHDCNCNSCKCCPEDQTLNFYYQVIGAFNPAQEYQERFSFSLNKVSGVYSKSFQWNCPNGSFLDFDQTIDTLVVSGKEYYNVYSKTLTDCNLSTIYFSTDAGILRMQLDGCTWDRIPKP